MDFLNYEKEHLDKLRNANAGCTVLLKKNGAFPLDAPCRIALYGSGARHTSIGGTGSGEVNVRFSISVEQGLRDAGFSVVTGAWLDAFDEVLEQAGRDFVQFIRQKAKETKQQAMLLGMGAVMPSPEYSLPMEEDADAAVYVVGRVSGEGSDRNAIPGDVLLSESEIRDIQKLNERFDRFLLVLNVGGPVDLTPVKEVSNILLLGQLGTETGAVLADLLLGRSYPSGKLASTWASADAYCHIGDLCERDDTRYREGIYVGYRWFDAARTEPLFPFGFGLGYTDFELKEEPVLVSGTRIYVSAAVTNTGAFSGREVFQVYLSAPSGRLDRAVQELAGFQKTGELAPEESETVKVSFDLKDFAGYDPEQAGWVLEAGDYVIRAGVSSRDTKPLAILQLDETVVIQKTRNVCGETDFTDWKPESLPQNELPEDLPVFPVSHTAFSTAETEYECGETIDERVAKLSDEELIRLNVGAFDPKGGLFGIIGTASRSVPGASGETAKSGNLPYLVMADGPAGLRLSRDFYRDKKGTHAIGSAIPESMLAFVPKIARRFLMQKAPRNAKIEHQYCTAIPVGSAVAASWDPDFAALCGDVVGAEMEHFGIQLWLAPALNIHRHIFCGRNYEYFSEDPLLSGKMAAALSRGVQKHPGCGVTLKHYAANNQETNRYNSNSMVSERALREIYLKGFGIAVREGAPAAVMTSYNLINGIHTSEHPGLLAGILRAEFGFQGVVMTDWVTGGSILSRHAKYPVPDAGRVAAAGGDLFMPGSKKENREIKAALKAGTLTRKQLSVNASRTLRLAEKTTRSGDVRRRKT